MTTRFLASLSAVLGLAGAAHAEVPQVATDIAPVHALVARVMQGVGAPDLIVRPGASPHGYAMRPSEAAMLERADLVVWMGEDLTPWLEGAIGALAGKAHVIELLGAEGTRILPFREGVAFAAHDHDAAKEEDHDHEDHAAKDHDHDHDHDHDAHDHDEHAHGDEDHDDHSHGHAHDGADPHAWLNPANARAWLAVIAAELAEHDPANAALYTANATAAQAELDALSAEIAAQIAPVRGKPFLVFHDAYQYFEAAFGVNAAGAIALSDAADPGPARIAQLRDLARDQNIACVFSEPQFDPKLVRTVFGDVVGHGVLDPLAGDVAPGPDLYPTLLRNMAAALTGCLATNG